MKEIWKLSGARQASFGIPTDSPTGWLTLRESFGEVDLSVEVGTGVEMVGTLDDSASEAEIWTALAHFEKWTDTTYQSQLDAREADAWADAEDY